jgi:hypothetical protein
METVFTRPRLYRILTIPLLSICHMASTPLAKVDSGVLGHELHQ